MHMHSLMQFLSYQLKRAQNPGRHFAILIGGLNVLCHFVADRDHEWTSRGCAERAKTLTGHEYHAYKLYGRG